MPPGQHQEALKAAHEDPKTASRGLTRPPKQPPQAPRHTGRMVADVFAKSFVNEKKGELALRMAGCRCAGDVERHHVSHDALSGVAPSLVSTSGYSPITPRTEHPTSVRPRARLQRVAIRHAAAPLASRLETRVQQQTEQVVKVQRKRRGQWKNQSDGIIAAGPRHVLAQRSSRQKQERVSHTRPTIQHGLHGGA